MGARPVSAIAALEDLLDEHSGRVKHGDDLVMQSVDRMAAMIAGKLDQGEDLAEAVVSSINFLLTASPR
jgi:hypothetical protein